MQRVSHPTIETVDDIARALGVSVKEARLAAGYAPKEQTRLPESEKLVEYFNALPETVREDVQAIVETLYRRHVSEPFHNVTDFVSLDAPTYSLPVTEPMKPVRLKAKK